MCTKLWSQKKSKLSTKNSFVFIAENHFAAYCMNFTKKYIIITKNHKIKCLVFVINSYKKVQFHVMKLKTFNQKDYFS